jgi:archaellum component FlaC
MSAPDRRSWDELVDTLRTAAGDVRSAIGRAGSSSTDDDVAAARLKGDVSRLEQSASELISKISVGLRERQSEIDTTFDRERAQLSVEQMKSSLEELATLAGSVSADIVSVASGTLKQSEPELKNVARALEDVAGSAASWIRAAIDPTREQPGKQSSQNRLPLDDL